MASAGGPPESFLEPGYRWLDQQVSFTAPPGDPGLKSACTSVWHLAGEIRSRRGRLGLTVSTVASKAGIRRQTLADIEMGRSWPDVATVVRILNVLELKLITQEMEPGQRSND